MELTRARLTMLVIEGMRTEEHSFMSQVGIGSESDCLLGQLKRVFETSDSNEGLKVGNQELVEKEMWRCHGGMYRKKVEIYP